MSWNSWYNNYFNKINITDIYHLQFKTIAL